MIKWLDAEQYSETRTNPIKLWKGEKLEWLQNHLLTDFLETFGIGIEYGSSTNGCNIPEYLNCDIDAEIFMDKLELLEKI